MQLVSLLYSDKKPGDVATRQLIVDLLLILFELFPPSSLPSIGSVPPRREVWETTPRHTIALPHPHQTLYSLLRALLLTPAPRAAEAPEVPLSPHEFIDALHRPRIYKAYLQELSDICRDYFWIFCHPNNTIWVLADVDEARVEKPRAPGGMTGGVEFEAMSYLVLLFTPSYVQWLTGAPQTTHFRLLNAFAKAAQDLNMSKDNEFSAHHLHTDLFLSGIERIILVMSSLKWRHGSPLAHPVDEIVDRTQGVGDILPYSAPRDFPLCHPRGSGSVRATVDGLTPHRSSACCTSSHHEDDDDDGPCPATSQDGPYAPVPAPRGSAKDRLEKSRSRCALERSLRTEPSLP